MSEQKAGQASPEKPEPTDRSSERDSDLSRTGSEQHRPAEIGGPKGPEPTRYGDWEVKGRCSDF